MPNSTVAVDVVTDYARAVINGDILAGRWVKLACERHLRDLERQGMDGFPYVFRPDLGDRVADFFTYCRHVKGPLAGEPIILDSWQRFILGSVFGWIHKDTELRRFRKAYVQVARGNAKSTMLSGLGLYMLMADGEIGSEVYAAATKAEQARIVFDAARRMAINSPDFLKRLEPGRARIEHVTTGSVFRPLSKDDQKTGDGLAPHLAIIDEYHAHATSEMYDVLTSAMTKRSQPLLFVITTAGFDLSSPCYAEYQYCCRLLEGAVENKEYFAYIAQLDPDDDPKDERVWAKANPLVAATEWGVRSLRADLKEALDDPRKMRNFLTKNMNLWVDQKDDGYLPLEKWRACESELPDLEGAEVYVGVDLSATTDLCSVAFEFPLDGGRYAVLHHSFMPADRLAERRRVDKVDYDLWVRQGYMTTVPGALIDLDFVADWVHKKVQSEGWQVREICVDPWRAAQFNRRMEEYGYMIVEVPQTIRYISEPTLHFRGCVLDGKVVHDGDPVLTWAVGNAVAREDANGNVQLAKNKSRDRIDPIVAVVTAHARAMHAEVSAIDVSAFIDDDFLDRLWS